MNLPAFLTALFEHGRTTVGDLALEVSADDRKLAAEILSRAEQTHRQEFPGKTPEWHPAAGGWAAELFYHACQFAVQRDLSADPIRTVLTTECPAAPAASRHYSVDLTFQFLPDLFRLARGTAPEDPLLAVLSEWAAAWPLSSIGMSQVASPPIEPLLARPLLSYYAERIIRRNDASRLTHPQVREEVRKQLGCHQQLAPELWSIVSGD